MIGVPFKAACDLVGLAGEVVGQNAAAAGEAFLGGDARPPLDLRSGLEGEGSWVVLAVRLRVTRLGWSGLLELVWPFEEDGSFGSGPSEL